MWKACQGLAVNRRGWPPWNAKAPPAGRELTAPTHRIQNKADRSSKHSLACKSLNVHWLPAAERVNLPGLLPGSKGVYKLVGTTLTTTR